MFRATIVALLVIVSQVAFCADGATTVRAWQTEDGLPHVAVRAIAQSRDGFLWVGSDGGLARFDGVRFITYGLREGLPFVQVRALVASRDGSVWASLNPRGLVRIKDGVLTDYSKHPDLPDRPLGPLSEDSTGRLWLGTGFEFLCWDGSHFTTLAQWPELTMSLAVTERLPGELWLGGYGMGLRVFRDNQWVEPPDVPDNGLRNCTAMAADTNGNLWVAAESGRAWRYGADGWRRIRFQQGPTNDVASYPFKITCGPDGSVYCGFAGGGAWRLDQDHFSMINANDGSGLGDPIVEALACDRDGQLWIGSLSSGLLRVSTATAESCRVRPGTIGDVIQSLLEVQPGVFWAGTLGAGATRWENGKTRALGEAEGSPPFIPYVNAMIRSRDGTIWLGAARALHQFREDRYVPQNDYGGIFREHSILALAEDPSGTLWAGCGRSLLVKVRDGKAEEFEAARGMKAFVALACAEDGTVWAASEGAGILRISGDKVTRYTRADGLGSDSVVALCIDSTGTLWAGTYGGGIACLRGDRFATFDASNGLPDDFISQIVDDGVGHLWLGGKLGVSVVALDEFQAVFAGKKKFIHAHTYGRADGMVSANCTQMAAIKASDGRVCFGTMRGFVRFRPQPALSREAPAVFVEDLLADGSTLLPGPGAACPPEVTLGPGRPRVDFHFTALALANPDALRFRYRLVGLDENWVEVGARRIATFPGLVAGHYRFEVSAASGVGPWSSAPAGVTLIVRPHFWETPWFYAGSALLAGLVAGLVLRATAKRRAAIEFARLERKRAVDDERRRIARDLHDDVGANLTQIALLSELAQSDLDKPDTATEHLDQIFTSAKDVARSLDEIVWSVNPAHDNLEGFVAHVVNLAQKLARSAGLRFRLEAPEQLPETPLSPGTQHHLFLAVKEAMHNVVRHAGASSLELTIVVTPELLCFTVKDDGRGFDPVAKPPAHGADGWMNLPARMAELGGECRRSSSLGAGTMVELRVPFDALQG